MDWGQGGKEKGSEDEGEEDTDRLEKEDNFFIAFFPFSFFFSCQILNVFGISLNPCQLSLAHHSSSFLHHAPLSSLLSLTFFLSFPVFPPSPSLSSSLSQLLLSFLLSLYSLLPSSLYSGLFFSMPPLPVSFLLPPSLSLLLSLTSSYPSLSKSLPSSFYPGLVSLLRPSPLSISLAFRISL